MDEVPELLSGLRISNLESNGVQFDITNVHDVFNECVIEDDKIDLSEGQNAARSNNQYMDPVCEFPAEPFSELWLKFKPLKETDLIRKSVIAEGNETRATMNSTVKILFFIYVEGSSDPVGHNKSNSYFSCCLNNSGLLRGIELAILSMTEGERSQFLIHHSLMFGELGCLPLIPKAATCLLRVVLSSIVVADEESNESTNESLGLPQMQKVFSRAITLNKQAKDYYNNGEYRKAVNLLKKSLNLMIECRLRDDAEEEEQKRFLCQQYLKLGICHNKLNEPYKTCIMFNEYHKIDNIYNNWKALFQNSKALIMIGNYEEALQKLKKALRLEPYNEEIQQQLTLLEQKIASADVYMETISKIASKIDERDENKKASKQFIDEIENMCDFINNDKEITSYKFELPSGLTNLEMECIENKVKEKNFSTILDFCEKRQIKYITINKCEK